jgi:tetratricopeptide (TPR) repeat protein
MLGKKAKIIIVIVAVVLILGGLLAWQTWRWQGKIGDLKNYVVSLFSGEKAEELPANIKEAYEKLKQDPTNADAYLVLTAWKREKGDVVGAIKLYEAALQVRPTDTLLLSNVAELYTRNNQYDKSEAAYLKIIETNPKWLSAYRSLVDLYHYQIPDKRAEIPGILEKGIKNNPEVEAEFVGQLAVYYKEFGPKEEAIKWYEKLVKLSPDNEAAKSDLEELKK